LLSVILKGNFSILIILLVLVREFTMLFRSISVIFLCVFVQHSAIAAQCQVVFPDVIATHGNGSGNSQINFGYNARLINNPDTELATRQVSHNLGSNINSCTSADCTASNISAETVSINFLSGGGSVNYNPPGSQITTFGTTSVNNYNQVSSSSDATLNFSDNHDVYFFEQLAVGYNNTLNLSAGKTYYIRSFSVGSQAQINVVGAGTAKVIIDSNINFTSPVIINSNAVNQTGDTSKLVMYVDGNVTFGSSSTFSGALYAKNITFISASYLFGVASGKKVNLGSNSTLTYDGNVFNADFGDICEVEAAQPIVDYRFDECTYTGLGFEVIDKTENYNAGIYGIDESADDAQINNALDLSKTDTSDWLSVPRGVVDGLNDFTISLWINTNKSKGQQEIFQALGKNKYDDELEIYLKGNKDVKVKIKDDSKTLKSNIVLTDGQWHHLLVTRENDKVCLFVDGDYQECDTGVGSGQLSVPYVDSIVIGQEQDAYSSDFNSSQSFEGLIDEFKIYALVLSTTEIISLYDNEYNGKNYDGSLRADVSCKGLLAFYRFEQLDFSSQINDNSDAGNHGLNDGGGSIANGQYCRGFDSNGKNSDSSTENAFSSSLDANDDIGNEGTISFWFNSNNGWADDNFNRVLFDATSTAENKYFVLRLKSDGRLDFRFEDSNDSDFSVTEPNVTARLPNTWYYLTVTWDFDNDTFQLYVDASSVVEQTKSTNGQLGELGTLIFGDNTTSYYTPDDSANGKFDEVRIYSKVLTQNEIQTDMDENFDCVNNINHYRIQHDGQGLTCDLETVVISACTNIYDGSDCIESHEEITLDLVATGASNTVNTTTTFIGRTDVNFNYTVNENITLSIENETISSTSSEKVCTNNKCIMTFADAGFIFSGINDIEVAGVANAGLTIQAVSNNNGVCVGVFNESKNVDFAIEMISPDRISDKKYTIASDDINQNRAGNIGSYKTINLTFGADSTASLGNNTYFDAGNIVLHAKHTIAATSENPAVTLFGNSAFYVRPYAFDIYPTNAYKQALTEQTAEAGTVTQQAGLEFNLLVKAINQQGDKTANFTNKSVELSLQRIAPISNGFDGFLTYNNGSITTTVTANDYSGGKTLSFMEGKFQDSEVKFSEVGLLKVALREQQTVSNVASYAQGSENVGRFTPAYFIQTIVDNNETNETGSITANHNDTCIINSWVYSGQKTIDNNVEVGSIKYGVEPILTLTAYNANHGLTKNYMGDFVKLDNYDVSFSSPLSIHSNGLPLLADVRAVGSFISIEDGILKYRLSDQHHFTYLRNVNSVIAPFYAAFEIPINSIIDNDGITIKPDDSNGSYFLNPSFTSQENIGVNVRFGRLIVENSFGPETSNISQPMYAQYLAEDGQYVTNTDDSCLSISSENNEVILTDGTLDKNLSGITSETSQLKNGYSQIIELTAPNAQGDINVEYTVPVWLQFDWLNADKNFDGPYNQNPSATATFGVYRGNDRIISWREIGN
jgi:MSHA biogenesis protein MshQ